MLHEYEVDVRWTYTGPGAKVIWVQRGLGFDLHVPSGVLDVHRGDGVQRSSNDCVSANVCPQLMCLPQELDKGIERGTELFFPTSQAGGELLDGVEVLLSYVIDVEDDDRVQGDEMLVHGAQVAVAGLGVVACCLCEFREGLFSVSGLPR